MIVRRPLSPLFSLRSEIARALRRSAVAVRLFGCLALVSVSTQAAELQLRNGDRLTGEIIRRADGRIHLSSMIFGNVVIAESDVVFVSDPKNPMDPSFGSPSSSAASASAPSHAGTRMPAPAPSNATPGAATVAAAPTADSPTGNARDAAQTTPSRWRGTIEFGFQQEAGRREGISTSLRADAERARGPNQLKVNVRSLYSELDDQLISERSDASFRWRRDLSQRIFAQAVTSFLSDNVKAIDQNYEQNAGFGYAIVKRDRHVINVGGGVTGQFRDALRLNEGFTVLGEVFEDYTFRINSRLTFVQDFFAQYSPVSRGDFLLRDGEIVAANNEIRNYRIRVNSALQGRVTETISMNLRFEYDLDNTVIEQSAKADQRLISSIGYAF